MMATCLMLWGRHALSRSPVTAAADDTTPSSSGGETPSWGTRAEYPMRCPACAAASCSDAASTAAAVCDLDWRVVTMVAAIV